MPLPFDRPLPAIPFVLVTSHAERRAQEMFLAHCTPEQRQCWVTSGYIDILGSEGGEYKLANFDISSNSFNVFYNSQLHQARMPMCVVILERGLPQYDRFLAQKILIETDECYFRSYTPFPT